MVLPLLSPDLKTDSSGRLASVIPHWTTSTMQAPCRRRSNGSRFVRWIRMGLGNRTVQPLSMVNYPCEREKLVSVWSSSVRLFTYDTVTFSTGFVNGGDKCGNDNNEGTWEKTREVENRSLLRGWRGSSLSSWFCNNSELKDTETRRIRITRKDM